jgi:hypothetical protein
MVAKDSSRNAEEELPEYSKHAAMKSIVRIFTLVAFSILRSAFASGDEEEPIALWFQGFGWERMGTLAFSASVISESDGLPIGVVIKRADHFPRSSPEPLGPWPCSFQGVGWALCEAFGYSARFVLGPDGGVVGVSFRVWNNSQSAQLVLKRKPGALPFYCTISQLDAPGIRLRDLGGFVNLDRPAEMEEWILPPRGRENVFVPIRDILPAGFVPVKGGQYFVEISPNVFPKGTVRRGHSIYPRFNAIWASFTETSLSIDPNIALREATRRLRGDL